MSIERVDGRYHWAATDIVTRFEGESERVAAARVWCDKFAAHLASPNITLAAMVSPSRHTANVKLLLELVARAEPGLHVLAPLGNIARRAEHMPHCDALLPIAVLWSVRDQPDCYAGKLAAWAEAHSDWKCEESRPGYLALWLRNLPELAYGLLAGMRAGGRRCMTCQQPVVGAWLARVSLARLAEKAEPHPLDRDALVTVPPAILLHDEGLRRSARRLLNQAREPPELARAIDGTLMRKDTPEDNWAALALALASPQRQDAALNEVVARWRAEPGGPWWHHLRGACTGHGWGRERLPKRMLPLVEAMWQPTQLSPMFWLQQLVVDDDEEKAWEKVRECVAEHLLQLALSREEQKVRSAALDALGVLQPGGDGSIARALGKLKDDPDIADRVRGTRAAIASKRRTIDAELAVDDARTAFWKAVGLSLSRG